MEYQIEDIETIHQKFQNIINNNTLYTNVLSPADIEMCKTIISYIIENKESTKTLVEIKHLFGTAIKNSLILKCARSAQLDADDLVFVEEKLRVKRCKSHSGVLVVTIFTSPYPSFVNEQGEKTTNIFSCKWNCHYCPDQPNQPRSYLEGEPGVLRANAHDFDPIKQMWARMDTLYSIGHPIDKLEVLVLGGTWYSYPRQYRTEFVRDMYYAANTYWDDPTTRRKAEHIDYERDTNRYATCKVIGLTLETRPDTITVTSIIEARHLGCTRFQLGIQHTDDAILDHINRQCSTQRTIKAIELLKDWGYKIDAHWMPNLPSATPEKDRTMLVDQLLGLTEPAEIVTNFVEGIDEWRVWPVVAPELQVDQWKVYPCEVVPYTQIEKWYRDGEYKPYTEDALEPILIDVKRHMYPWIRLNRIIRDIPTDYIIASADHPNTRQLLQQKLKANGWKCRCIRCREVKQTTIPDVLCYRIDEYEASNGTEYFISATDRTGDVLCGFVRLRMKKSQPTAWIRELHVYGQLQLTTGSAAKQTATQHKGIGKTLMGFARILAIKCNKISIKVISGEGTKEYYANLGYTDGKYGYMVLDL
jgi:histone acetyltransferase (RNA polymerase elongator complex component)